MARAFRAAELEYVCGGDDEYVAEPTYDTPAEPTYDTPAEPTYDTPAEPTYDTPAEPTYQAPAEPTYQAPAEPTYQAPTEQQPAASYGVQQYDDGSSLQTFDDGSTLARDTEGNYSSSPAPDYGGYQPQQGDPRAMGENVGAVLENDNTLPAQSSQDPTPAAAADPRAEGENTGSVLGRFEDPRALAAAVAAGVAPANLSPSEDATFRQAYRQALRDADLPTSRPFDTHLPNIDLQGNRVPGAQYQFEAPVSGRGSAIVPGSTEPVVIRNDAGGHLYPDDPVQNRGPHLNTPDGGHYDYDRGRAPSPGTYTPDNPVRVTDPLPEPRGNFATFAEREAALHAPPGAAAAERSAAVIAAENAGAVTAAERAAATRALESAAPTLLRRGATAILGSAVGGAALDLLTSSTPAAAATLDDSRRIEYDAIRLERAGLPPDEAFRTANANYNNGGIPSFEERGLMRGWADEAAGRGMDRAAADLSAYGRLQTHRADLAAAERQRLIDATANASTWTFAP